MQLTIASRNPNKIKRLKNLILCIRKEIVIDDISQLSIPYPNESGKTQQENLLIKLTYYYSILNKNIISEDDCFEFKVEDKLISIVNVNSFFSGEKDLFLSWRNFFTNNHISKGKLIKYFGVVINNKFKKRKAVIPINVHLHGLIQNKREINILNNFIGPISCKTSFAQMGEKEKKLFLLKKCTRQLKELLIY